MTDDTQNPELSTDAKHRREASLLNAVHDKKCLVTWNGNDAGTLWECLWKWSDESGYQSKTCASGFFGGWHTCDSAETFLAALNKDIAEFRFRGI